MTQVVLGHGVSGCFGTRVAPNAQRSRFPFASETSFPLCTRNDPHFSPFGFGNTPTLQIRRVRVQQPDEILLEACPI